MEETRQKLFVQLFVMATVVSLSLILTVYIASTYYKDVSDQSFWTPSPTETLTETPVTPTRPTDTRTPTLTPTQEPTVVKNCTYSSLYWFYHPETWPPQVVIGSLTYTKEEALAILQSPSQDSRSLLFAQLHAAILNYLAGAEFDFVRQTTIDASTWLYEHPLGAPVSEADQRDGLALAETLENYNLGITGPGRCPDEPAPQVPTDTPTSVYSPTPTETMTSTPYPTVKFVPSDTPKKTRVPPTRPPTQPPPSPTNPPPRPTDTKPPPPPTPKPTD